MKVGSSAAGVGQRLVRGPGLFLEAAVRSLRAPATSGQRWTSALAVMLTVAVLLYGAPVRFSVAPEGGRPTTSGAAAGPQPSPGGPTPTAPAPSSGSGSPPAPTGGESPVPRGAAPGPAPDRQPPGTATTPPAVVALVRSGGGLPGRDDAAIAAAFLDSASFGAATVPVTAHDDATCEDAAARGDVAIASVGLPAPLSDCLVDRGVTVVAFDQLGSRRGTRDAGGVVSTRRGIEAALLDLGRWGIRSGDLAGKVGVVAAAADRPRIDAVVAGLRAIGVDVASVAYVEDDAISADVSEGVRTFAAADIGRVILAVPVVVQRRWVAVEQVLRPGAVRYFVADAWDSVTNETYPATFDGAVAYTSVRVPWFAREHGETDEQSRCRQVWEGAAAHMLDAEALTVYAWCQHVLLVQGALDAARTGTSFLEAVEARTFPSPLTSTLEGGEDGYGPGQDAVLVWRATCGCWQESSPFGARRS